MQRFVRQYFRLDGTFDSMAACIRHGKCTNDYINPTKTNPMLEAFRNLSRPCTMKLANVERVYLTAEIPSQFMEGF